MRHKHADKIIDWAENGGEWEYRVATDQKWRDCHILGPEWITDFEFRRKPKAPRVIYGNIYNTGGWYGYLNERDAHKVYENDNRMETGVKFIEVTPEIQALLDKENVPTT